MTNFWPGCVAIMNSYGFGSSRQGNQINGIVIHHTANGGGISAIPYMAGPNNRNSHPTYGIYNNGGAVGIVDPDKKPWSTSGRPDLEAVSVEVDNAGGAATGWAISDAAIETIAAITAYHYMNSPKAGKGIERNVVGKANHGFFVAWHSQYDATACPGPDMVSKIDRIIARALEIAGGAPPVTPPKPTTPPVVPSQKYTFRMWNGDGIRYEEPTGVFGAAIQRGLALKGDAVYNDSINAIDGDWGINTRKGIQIVARAGGYRGPIDGKLGKNTFKAVQVLARNGGYTGPIDGIPGINTWTGFKKYLGQ